MRQGKRVVERRGKIEGKERKRRRKNKEKEKDSNETVQHQQQREKGRGAFSFSPPLSKGDAVEVVFQHVWYAATVINVSSDGSCTVRYTPRNSPSSAGGNEEEFFRAEHVADAMRRVVYDGSNVRSATAAAGVVTFPGAGATAAEAAAMEKERQQEERKARARRNHEEAKRKLRLKKRERERAEAEEKAKMAATEEEW
jgi:sRNA-binding protein